MRNHTSVEQPFSVIVSDTRTHSNNLSFSEKAGLEISEIADADISASYGHTWTRSHTFTLTVPIRVAPGTEVTAFASQPVLRVHGDFTLELANTTWILRDVYFDTPDSKATWGRHEFVERHPTPEELPAAKVPGLA